MSVDVRGLKITIGGKPIVSDADMTIADGERVGLIGSSGSGKSMIAKAMLGLLPLTAVTNGSIDMGGTEIIGASERALADLRGRYVGAVFQNPAASLNPVMTVAQQIALPLRLHYDLTKAERADRVNALLSKVGLDLDMAGKYPHELSGGQQQRVGIATALITSPRFIIADEPTTALDSITQRQIVDLLTSLVDPLHHQILRPAHRTPPSPLRRLRRRPRRRMSGRDRRLRIRQIHADPHYAGLGIRGLRQRGIREPIHCRRPKIAGIRGPAPRIGTGVPGPVLLARPTLASRQISG